MIVEGSPSRRGTGTGLAWPRLVTTDQLGVTNVDLGDGDVRLGLNSGGEAQVPRWAAARETELFERAYGTSLTVEVN